MLALCFTGCSSAKDSDVIDDNTLLIAYTDENAPFISKTDSGYEGFDVDVLDAIFDSIKGEYDNYQIVKVDEDYKIGEDTAYTDDDGNEYTASILLGGVQKNTGTLNSDYSLSQPLITNRIITVVPQNSNIKSYAELSGAKVGVVSEQAKTALDKNSTIKNALKSVKEYSDAKTALVDLSSGDIDAVVIDEFNYCTAKINPEEFSSNNEVLASEYFTELSGELDTIDYVFAVKKWDSLCESINESIYELKSEDYEGEDSFTPIVEKYFGYNASSFNYVPEN
jgi:ABC-type amino acid transport substrate-binding protein